MDKIKCYTAWTGAKNHSYPFEKVGTRCYCGETVVTKELKEEWESAWNRAATRISCAD
jgi:hypothetical protein